MATSSVSTIRVRPLKRVVLTSSIFSGMTGGVYLAVYVLPQLSDGSPQAPLGLIIYVSLAALLLIAAAIGYIIGKRWAWYLNLVAGIGQLLFPGGLFEFKLDAYHLTAWIGPLLTLAILFVMWKQNHTRR